MAQIMPSEKPLPRKKLKFLKEEQDRKKRLQLGLPVRKIRRQIPWGYVSDPNVPKLLLPIDKAFLCLVRAKEFLKTDSYVDVSNWLKSCGFPISHEGLAKLMKSRPPFDEVLLPLEERMKLL